MVRAVAVEVLALASISLFVAMVAVWTGMGPLSKHRGASPFAVRASPRSKRPGLPSRSGMPRHPYGGRAVARIGMGDHCESGARWMGSRADLRETAGDAGLGAGRDASSVAFGFGHDLQRHRRAPCFRRVDPGFDRHRATGIGPGTTGCGHGGQCARWRWWRQDADRSDRAR